MEITQLDYYAALDVAPSASIDQIERAYRFALDSYGPASLAAYGLLSDEERNEIVAFLEKARRTLCNESARREYNRKLELAGTYPPERLQFSVEPGETTGSDTAPELPLAQVEPRTPQAAEAAPAKAAPPPAPKERSWWPFAEKEKEKAAPAPAPAAAAAPAAPPTIPALDGRPIGGPELRQIREALGLRLEDISAQTKISLSNLRFLEEGKYTFLPASVYVKGFLRTYAKILRIDAEKAIRDYMAAFDAHRQS